jgi:Holliday junction resolvase
MSGEPTRAGGIRFEYKTIAALADDGYVTMRAAGSKGAIDIIAMKPGQLLYVQAKRTGICSAAEWDRVHELATWVGAIPVLAVNGPKGRGIVLWRLLGPKRRRLDWAHQPVTRFHTDELDPA